MILVKAKRKEVKDCGCGCVPPGKTAKKNLPKKAVETSGKK